MFEAVHKLSKQKRAYSEYYYFGTMKGDYLSEILNNVRISGAINSKYNVRRYECYEEKGMVTVITELIP